MLPRTRSFPSDKVGVRLRASRALVWRSGTETPSSVREPSTDDGADFGDRFTVRRLLGRGGMGRVFLAHDAELEREVALKVVDSVDPRAFVQFKGEFRRTAALTHPNVVQLYELFVEDTRAWFTMERVTGQPFDRALRGAANPGAPVSEAGLLPFAAALAQAVAGLLALHADGIVHRDVKPSNLLVTAEGRVVLLDFGVATSLQDIGPNADASAVAGTLRYMPPEAFDGAVSPASDAYALSVMSYEILTGRLPAPAGAASGGRYGAWVDIPRPVRTLVPWVPEPLAALLDGMLARDPGERPSLTALAGALRRLLDEAPSDPQPPTLPAPFVGRVEVLAKLRECWEEVRHGRPLIVDLIAPSGMGKTELVRRFCSERADEGALILLGRCHPQENVPFRAFDEVLDRLAQYLDHLPVSAVAELAPRELWHLLQVFPAFGRVEAFDHVSTGPEARVPSDRPAVRASAFQALRELLQRVAATVGLLVAIDDFHWADGDSLALLESLLEMEAPLLLVLVSRSEDTGSDALQALRRGRVGQAIGGLIPLSLQPLSLEECRDLVVGFDGEASEGTVARLAREAGGSPLFLTELLRGGSSEPAGARTLDQMIMRRASVLPVEERSLLAAVCVAGQPTPLAWALDAAGLTASARDVADRLVRRALLRVTESPHGRAVAPYHHRVAGAVADDLRAEERREWHGRLADSLSVPGRADAERLLRHLDASGRDAEAAVQARRAARDAEERLAFHRAAELHEMVLSRGWADRPTETRRLLADALASTGQAARAAELYRGILREPGVAAEQRTVLRARAVGQDLNAGAVEQGQRELAPLLRELGAGLPSNPTLAVVWAVLFRVLIGVRGTGFEPVREEQVPTLLRLRLDLLWVAATSLTLVDHVLADAAGARLAWEAVRVGEPRRISRALAYKAGADAFLLGRRGHDRALALLDEASALAATHGTIGDRAYCRGVEGTVRWARGEWAESAAAVDAFLSVGRMLIDVMPGGPTSVYGFLYSAVAHTGGLRRLAAELPEQLEGFERTGDRLGRSSCLLGQPSVAWLVLDRPDELEARADALLVEWGDRRFLTQHYHGMITRAHVHLYRRRPAMALAVLDDAWAALTRSRILTIEVIASEMWFLRGRVAAAVARVATGSERARATATLATARRRVAGTRLPWSAALTGLLDAASVDAGEGDTSLLLAAATAAERAGLPHLAAGARWRAGDDRGRAWMEEQGAVDPERLAATFGW